ncbi:hypothetical protein AB837_00604 [bacterium AB1]|nr:hypothetical protein AB837_00604 [bacterium AB1]
MPTIEELKDNVMRSFRILKPEKGYLTPLEISLCNRAEQKLEKCVDHFLKNEFTIEPYNEAVDTNLRTKLSEFQQKVVNTSTENMSELRVFFNDFFLKQPNFQTMSIYDKNKNYFTPFYILTSSLMVLNFKNADLAINLSFAHGVFKTKEKAEIRQDYDFLVEKYSKDMDDYYKQLQQTNDEIDKLKQTIKNHELEIERLKNDFKREHQEVIKKCVIIMNQRKKIKEYEQQIQNMQLIINQSCSLDQTNKQMKELSLDKEKQLTLREERKKLTKNQSNLHRIQLLEEEITQTDKQECQKLESRIKSESAYSINAQDFFYDAKYYDDTIDELTHEAVCEESNMLYELKEN